MSQIKLAEHQFLGFAHASKGYSVEELAKSMGLTKSEWLKLREKVDLKQSDKEDLDALFGIDPHILAKDEK